MINNILQNIMMSKINPQMRAQIENLYNTAMKSGNPEQFIMQRLGNNPTFQQVVNLVRSKNPQELYSYLGNVYNSLN